MLHHGWIVQTSLLNSSSFHYVDSLNLLYCLGITECLVDTIKLFEVVTEFLLCLTKADRAVKDKRDKFYQFKYM